MVDRDDRLRIGRILQHASMRRERRQATVTQVGTAEAQPTGQPSSPHVQDNPSTSYPTPSSTSSSRRRRDSAEGSSQAPSFCRPRWDTLVTHPVDDVALVPPPEVDDPPAEKASHDDDDELEGFPGGSSDMSLLVGYADHTARHVWDGETREPQKFYNHERKILSLKQTYEAWFQDVHAAFGLKDLLVSVTT
ncbi:unnamed protein product [Lathyrus sativus]|nr:unnamed protein product [Lathyrus sativus]